MDFSRDTKVQLFHATALAEKVAQELSDNGFVDAPHEVRKLLPIDNTDKVQGLLDGVIPALKTKLLDKANSAAGMSSGETVALAYTCALEGFLNAVFVAPANDPGDYTINLMFPVVHQNGDGIRKIELD